MNDKQIESLALVLTLADETITGGKFRKAFENMVDKFLEEKTVYIDGEPLTQEKFDEIYKEYKKYKEENIIFRETWIRNISGIGLYSPIHPKK